MLKDHGTWLVLPAYRNQSIDLLSKSIDWFLNERCIHSHIKQKDSLEKRTERNVFRAYVENQTPLEPILYCASKSKETKEQGSSFLCI